MEAGKPTRVKRTAPAKRSARAGGAVRGAGSGARLGSGAPSPAQIRAGLDVRWLRELSVALALPEERVTAVVRIPSATWHRRQQAGRLTPTESDRAANVIRVMATAVAFFGKDREAASRWMQRPAPALGGETPLEHSDTATGAQEVIDLLARLEYGIFV